MKQAFILASFITVLLTANPDFGIAHTDITSCRECLEKEYDEKTWYIKKTVQNRQRSDSLTQAVELESQGRPFSLWAVKSAPNERSTILKANETLKLFCKCSHVYDEPAIRDLFFWATDANLKIQGTIGAFLEIECDKSVVISYNMHFPQNLKESARQLLVDYVNEAYKIQTKD